jgi:hypothetical protein
MVGVVSIEKFPARAANRIGTVLACGEVRHPRALHARLLLSYVHESTVVNSERSYSFRKSLSSLEWIGTQTSDTGNNQFSSAVDQVRLNCNEIVDHSLTTSVALKTFRRRP